MTLDVHLMTLATLLIRSVVSLLFLWLIVRLAGKRGLGSATPFDLIVAIMLGNLANDTVLGLISIPEGVVGLGMLAWVHLLVKLVTQRFALLHRWCWGGPVVLVQHGRLQRDAMARERLSALHIGTVFREAGIERVNDVQELRQEPDGRYSAIRRSEARPVTNANLSAGQEEEPWQHAA